MRKLIPKPNPGDPIRAALFQDIAEITQKVDNRSIGTAGPGLDLSNMASQVPATTRVTAVVRMKQDAVPETLPEANTILAQTYGGLGDLVGDLNAVVQVWDNSVGAWADVMDREIQVTPLAGLPLLNNDILVVWYDPQAQRWFPTFSQEVALVRISNNVPNGNGLMQGFIQVFNNVTLTYSDGEAVWVLSAN